MKNPFEIEGNWYKANLHIHTTESDGKCSVSEVISSYKQQGFHILALTDHWKVASTSHLDTGEDILIINGAELDVDRTEFGSNFHVVLLGICADDIPDKNITVENLIKEVKGKGGVCYIAHPYWSGLTINDLLRIKTALGIEVYNNECELEIGKGYGMVHWDEILMKGVKCYGFATDDDHQRFEGIGGGFIMLKMDKLTINNFFMALKDGCFYSSTGPLIYDLRLLSDKIYVKCSPCKTVSFIGNHQEGFVFHQKRLPSKGDFDESPLTEVEYQLKGTEKYIRVEITDFEGRKAWSQPFFFKFD